MRNPGPLPQEDRRRRAAVVFEDVTKAAGIDQYHHRSRRAERATIIEAASSGVALLDYDNDGWLDTYRSGFGLRRSLQ